MSSSAQSLNKLMMMYKTGIGSLRRYVLTRTTEAYSTVDGILLKVIFIKKVLNLIQITQSRVSNL